MEKLLNFSLNTFCANIAEIAYFRLRFISHITLWVLWMTSYSLFLKLTLFNVNLIAFDEVLNYTHFSDLLPSNKL